MKKSPGTALLALLMMSALASTFLLRTWFVASLYNDTISQREAWYKKLYSTDAALSLGIVLVKTHFDHILGLCKQESKPLILDITRLFPLQAGQLGKQQRMLLSLQKYGDDKQGGALLVKASCVATRTNLCDVQCVIKKAPPSLLAKPNEHAVVVEYFTIGTGV